MKTRIFGSFSGFGATALLATSFYSGVAYAQESLAGLGAASAMGASLGAAAAGTAVNTGRVPRNAGETNELIEEAGNAGSVQSVRLGGQVSVGVTAAVSSAPAPQLYGLNVRKAVRELRRMPTVASSKGGLPRQREGKVARQRRLARLSPQARKRAIQRKYRISPRGWLASYLPQDRYKFGKVWQYVSTEDSRYYFTPQGLGRRNFNPNRVIGFRTWQEAMAAGYRPDPLSKPEPAAKILRLSTQTRGENYYRYVGYVYSGQVNAAAMDATYRYTQIVASQIGRRAWAKGYLSPTLDRIFAASMEGNKNMVPSYIGRVVAALDTPNGRSPNFPGAMGAPTNLAGNPFGTPTAGNPNLGGSADRREEDFNRFRNNAGSMANVPANR